MEGTVLPAIDETDDVVLEALAWDLANIVLQSKYSALNSFLKYVDVDPNLELDFQGMGSMTGLEFSLLSSDWKMACIFLNYGADPAKNSFSGCIKITGYRVYQAFNVKTRIPGLDGLAAIAGSEEAATFVSLLRVCLEPESLPHDLLQATLSWLNSLDSNYQTALLKRLNTAALLFLRNNLPQEVSYTILVDLARMELWSYFTDTVVSSLVA